MTKKKKKITANTLTRDWLISKVDIDVVVARFGGKVLHITGAITVVAAVHLGLHWSLDTETQASLTRTLHVHGEHRWLVGDASLQT